MDLDTLLGLMSIYQALLAVSLGMLSFIACLTVGSYFFPR